MNRLLHHVSCCIVICAYGLSATGCGAKPKDTVYDGARELPALQVPADLSRPQETRLMRIPESQSILLIPPQSGAGPDQPATAGDELERPPKLLPDQ